MTVHSRLQTGRDLPERLLLTTDERAVLLRDHPLGAATARYAKAFHRPYSPDQPPRYCPLCLAEPEPYWHAEWSQPLAVVCLRHAIKLVPQCTHCRQQAHASIAWAASNTQLWQCTERIADQRPGKRRRAPWCGGDLREAPARPVSDDVLEAQRTLLDLGRSPGTATTVWKHKTTRGLAFNALCELIREGSGHRLDILSTSTWVGDALPALAHAGAVMNAPTVPDASALLDEYGLLPVTGRTAPLFDVIRMRSAPHSSLLVMLQLRRHKEHLTKADRLMYRTISNYPRYPAAFLRGREPGLSSGRAHKYQTGELRYSAIPQAIWPEIVPPVLSQLATKPLYATTMAMCLAKVGSAREWADITTGLTLPLAQATNMGALWKQVDRVLGWRDLHKTLSRLAERLIDDPPPIDYLRRRLFGLTPTLFLEAVASAAGPLDPDEQRALALRLWQRFTHSSPRFAPPELRGPTTFAEAPAGMLEAAGQRLLALAHADHEPLEWAPRPVLSARDMSQPATETSLMTRRTMVDEPRTSTTRVDPSTAGVSATALPGRNMLFDAVSDE